MERIERLAAHIDEGLILAHSNQVARRRLALLLFDSAVELMMYREVSYLFALEEPVRQMIQQHEKAVERGYISEGTREWVEDARRRVTSSKRRREIKERFNAKAAFLGEAGLLQPVQVRVLKKLHKYRNEAYHEDRLRSRTLDSALRIYILAICDLLQNLPIHSFVSSERSNVPPTVAKYLGWDAGVHFDTNQRIASAILERESMTSPSALGEALSDHFMYRLDDFDESLDFVADRMSYVRSDGPWERDDVLHLVQIKDDDLFAAFATRDKARAFPAPIRRSGLEEWRSEAGRLRFELNELAAFEVFAKLEDDFEPIEQKVNEHVIAVDNDIQREIDIARGN